MDLSSVEETMTEVRRNWNVMLQDQFNPIMVALEMLQGGNPAHDYDSFMRLHGKLEESMAVIVESNNILNVCSLLTVQNITQASTMQCQYLEALSTTLNVRLSLASYEVANMSIVSKDIVCKVGEGIAEFRDQVQFKRAELPEIWSKVQLYKDTFAITSKLESVQKQQIQALELSRKRFFIPAARTLMGAIYDAKYVMSTTQAITTGELTKLLEANRDNMFDQIIDEVHTLLYLKEVRSAQQLFSHLLERIPEARSLPVGALKRAAATTAEVTVAASDSELVLAPAEFDFEPRSNAVAYLTSLVRAAAILELIPQFLSIVTQRVVSELYQITERELQQTAKQYHSDASSQPFRFRSGTEDGVGESPLFVPVLRGNMDRVDSNEFDAFVPHLRRLCGRTLGPYLVVANCIRTIGETVQQIVDASGTNKLDVHAFYRNCLSAIHGEVKNWLSCMLHGSKTTSRIFTNSTVAITEALKDKKDSQSRGNGRAPLYQFINVAEGSRVLAGILEPTAVLSAKDEEAARKLASMLVVDPFATGKQDSGHRSIVKPNLQYLAILYRPFAQLDGWLERLFPQDHEEAGPFIDASFVEGVLSEEYLPAIENYAMQELTRAFNGTDALLWHALTEPDAALAIGRGANSLLHCVSSFIGLLCQVTCVLHQIPGSQAECEQLMISLMNSFLDRCEAKFRDLVTNKAASDEGAAPTFVAVSSTFVAHEALRQLLQQHSMLTGAEDETLDGILARKESFLLEKLKSDRSLHRNEIIFDYRILRSIALMQRSLELLPQILGDSTFGSVPSFPLFRPEFRSNETGRLVSNFFDGTARGVIPLSGDFDSRYNGFLLTVRKLSETCLFTLRTELRVHCFYFLDLAHREGNYALEEEAGDEPDAYVSSLAGDLIRFEALVTDWLPFSRYHVVVDELDESLVGMLLADFRYIRALNAAGCHKLQTNVSTLEQILALISAGSTAGMEPARQFYRLAAAGPEKLIELAPHCEHKFALQHYQAIFDVYYRDSSGDAGLQRTHNNQLVRLKYLLEGGNDSTTGKT